MTVDRATNGEIYKPIFSDNSHEFRSEISWHTAFDRIKYGFNETRWFIDGGPIKCYSAFLWRKSKTRS